MQMTKGLKSAPNCTGRATKADVSYLESTTERHAAVYDSPSQITPCQIRLGNASNAQLVGRLRAIIYHKNF